MSKDIYIVTGCSSGIGKEICHELLFKKKFVLGISKSKVEFNSEKFFFVKKNFDKKTIIGNKIKKIIKNKIKINLILNAGINYNKNTKINSTNLMKILNVNFLNQFFFLISLSEKYKNKLNEVLFISSYDVFSKKPSQFFGYTFSKILTFEVHRLIKKFKDSFKFNTKLAFLGAVDTKMYKRSNKENYLSNKNKNRILNANFVAKSLLNFLKTKKNVIFLPQKKNNKNIKLYLRQLKKIIL